MILNDKGRAVRRPIGFYRGKYVVDESSIGACGSVQISSDYGEKWLGGQDEGRIQPFSKASPRKLRS